MTTIHLTTVQAQALTCAYWHRLISTNQLQRLLAPHVLGPRYVQRQMAGLREQELAAAARHPSGHLLWYTTETGAVLVEASGEVDRRAYRMTAAKAVPVLQAHRLDVVETGIAFVESARRHGHDCGPLSWTPEVGHPYGHRYNLAAEDRDAVIADAVLHYTAEAGGHRSQHTFFVEVDRATMPVARLARKLLAYQRYHAHVPRHRGADGAPAWRRRYPKFPRILIVLSGAPEHLLDRRLADLRGHAAALRLPNTLTVLATTLTQLRELGPTVDIAVPVLDEDPTPTPLVWVGQAQ